MGRLALIHTDTSSLGFRVHSQLIIPISLHSRSVIQAASALQLVVVPSQVFPAVVTPPTQLVSVTIRGLSFGRSRVP